MDFLFYGNLVNEFSVAENVQTDHEDLCCITMLCDRQLAKQFRTHQPWFQRTKYVDEVTIFPVLDNGNMYLT